MNKIILIFSFLIVILEVKVNRVIYLKCFKRIMLNR